MQFQVPQFIDVEDKIFGPFTFKQFIYIVGGAGLAFAFYQYTPKPINTTLAFASLGIGAAFAFVKINERPLIFFAEAAFYYFIRKKLYIWKKRKPKTKAKNEAVKKDSQISIPKLSENKLKDLAWGLDINEAVAQERLSEQLEKSKKTLKDLNDELNQLKI